MGFFLLDILLEVNVLQIVNEVKVRSKSWSKMGNLINGIKEGPSKMRLWSITHVKNYANCAAHSLGHEAIFFCHR